jgi:hypothetical protein
MMGDDAPLWLALFILLGAAFALGFVSGLHVNLMGAA